MKKISQINWQRYKESEAGKEAIASFEKIYNTDITSEEILSIVKRFNPIVFDDLDSREKKAFITQLEYANDVLYELIVEKELLDNVETYDEVYNAFTTDFLQVFQDDLTDIEKAPQSLFKKILRGNPCTSIMLYGYIPEFFIPNLYSMQFIYWKKLVEKYELEMPAIPSRSDYRGRWDYYLYMCSVLYDFSRENNFETPGELCAFLYDYELPLLKEEIENESSKEMPEVPAQAWILVGNYPDDENYIMENAFWQANELTEKGDILLFYEKSPVKALNSVWIAQQDGIIDPFFHYYSNTYIGNRISIPEEQAITYQDFKDNEYFANRDKKGNFVSKNFQDVSGWAVTYEDYKEVLRMLESKGFDTSVLPKLYEPTKIGNFTIKVEKDVSEKLLIPLLEQMGWKKDVDFKAEVEFNAGRTKTNHSSDRRPDFCLHITEKNDDIEAKVAIEVKKHMKSQKEIHENFIQGRSYAKWGNVEVLVLVDMKQILVYERDKDYNFNENKPKKYSWADMENPDKYAELKKILSAQ